MANLASGAGGEIYKDGKKTVIGAATNFFDLIFLKRNHRKLMHEALMLKEMRETIKREIRRFKMPGIREWIARASVIEGEVEDLATSYNNVTQHKWTWFSRPNISKKMKEKCKEVRSHWEEGQFKKAEADLDLPERVTRMGTLKLEENSSLHEVLQHVLQFLEDKNIRRIGICGMVGTGKTTVLQNLNNHEKVAKMFDMVIYVTVPKELREKGVQDAILRRLILDVDCNADVNAAALIISEELKGKKCLILLDNVQDWIDLNRIMGIDENPDSKVVLASEYDYSNQCVMKADELVKVEPLLPHEAWNMFQKKVGDYISNPSIEPLARGVVKECYGLPMLIDRLAITFKEKGQNEVLWRDGLEQLKTWDCSVKLVGMDEVLVRLQICYDHLKDDEQKVCFLYGALYPEESEIHVDYLLECWKAEGFIGSASVFRRARWSGHRVLNELIKVSLLERSDKSKCVKMNNLFRKMALRISSQSTNSKFLVELPEGLEESPTKEELEPASRISLMKSRLRTLPEILNCSRLLTLLLRSNMYLTSIPKWFFKSMSLLQVLDLHGTGIATLPSSLPFLINLKALYLDSCSELKEIPSGVEKLEHLEVLDIRETKLNLLQIGSLVWLKCLRLSLCNFDTANYAEAQVSKFDLLEELTIDVGSLEEGWDKIVDPVIKDIVKLKKLTSLRFCFPKVDSLGVFVQEWPMWEEGSLTFHFAIGCHNSAFAQILESIDHPGYKILKLANGDGVNLIIMKVLTKTNALGLIDYEGVSSLSDFGIENMNMIFDCLIKGCSKIKTIINGDGISEAVLQWLKNLHITDVPNLENIWQGPVHAGSLAQLTTVTLSNCPKLMKIFSNGMIQQLIQLTHLRVEECHQIKEIIMKSENTQLKNQALPKLKTLELIHLPRLTSIWAKDSLEWPSLQEVKISNCLMLKSLPFNKVNATKLRSNKGQQSWWEALDDAIKQRLLHLFNQLL